MKIDIFLAADRRYLLARGSFVPTDACRKMHGPLVSCGQVQVPGTATSRNWEQVLGKLQRREYTLIDRSQAELLLGVPIKRAFDHPILEPPEHASAAGQSASALSNARVRASQMLRLISRGRDVSRD